ncbi:MAG TPA: hypothetical protein VFZ08_05150 [Terriglobia bacterium]|nr:hypothetical protein [Terriglobia bacterium]
MERIVTCFRANSKLPFHSQDVPIGGIEGGFAAFGTVAGLGDNGSKL